MTTSDHTWSVRVTAFDREPAKAFVRRHRLEIGNPVEFDPEYEHVTALEHALAALGADLAGGLRALARKRRVLLDHVEVLVMASLGNPLVYLGVIGEEGSPAIEHVRVRAFTSPADAEDDLRRLWDEVLRRSPLVRTFERAATLEVELRFTH